MQRKCIRFIGRICFRKYKFRRVYHKNIIYRIQTASIPVCINNKSITKNIMLEVDSKSINEAVIEGKRSIRSIDKTSYTFSSTQIEKAEDGRGLIATLPNLHIDKTTNSFLFSSLFWTFDKKMPYSCMRG